LNLKPPEYEVPTIQLQESVTIKETVFFFLRTKNYITVKQNVKTTKTWNYYKTAFGEITE
jgi:hypothetical protein